eukprot:TRINITY_DN103022_c0_g1_i1.p1 TRINITY_DN103022_c0_g1~~TRINITY_DN103022_c0_g1_i1.p1  ORF type:complete len:802 (-),score=154.15 TRINITY_DN103022_c0_g1_i1:195-2600(-)
MMQPGRYSHVNVAVVVCFALVAGQNEELRQAALAAKFDESTCSGAGSDVTDTESDFIADGQRKYFTYDLKEVRSWTQLQGLRTCLESVKGHAWLRGRENLWKVHEWAYGQLGQNVNLQQLDRQGWLEYNPVSSTNSVLAFDAVATAPMSSFSNSLQQPCNALSNAAFYEVSLDVCNTSSFAAPGGWSWKDEIIAAGAGMAFGSFAMHAAPTSDSNLVMPANQSVWASYSTGGFDTAAMNVLFYVLFQAQVRSFLASSDVAAVEPILKFASTGANYAGDAAAVSQRYVETMASATAEWQDGIAWLVQNCPNYMLSAIGIVLVNIRAIVHPEIFGTNAAEKLYGVVCSILFKSLMSDGETKVPMFCAAGSSWYTAITTISWRVPKDLHTSMSLLVNSLEALVEAMYWQETKVKPVSYIQTAQDAGATGPTEPSCWRQMHGNWHRNAAQMSRKMATAIGTQAEGMTLVPPLTDDQKSAAVANLADLASDFMVFKQSLQIMKAADSVNMCRLFKHAKARASSISPGPKWMPMSLFDPAYVNAKLLSMTKDMDPLLDAVSFSGESDSLTGSCKYEYGAKVTRISGLSQVTVKQLDLKFSHMSSEDGIIIRATLSTGICDLNLDVSSTAEVTQKARTKIGKYLCLEKSVDATARASGSFSFDAVVSADVKVDALLLNSDGALSATVDQFNINCGNLKVDELDINGLIGEELIRRSVNTAFKKGLREAVCKKAEDTMKSVLQKELSAQVNDLGKKVQVPQGRRLSTQFTCPTKDDTSMVDAAHTRESALSFFICCFLLLLTIAWNSSS